MNRFLFGKEKGLYTMRACWKHDEWEKGQRRKWETIKLRRGVTRRNWKRRRLINSCYLRIVMDLVNSRANIIYLTKTIRIAKHGWRWWKDEVISIELICRWLVTVSAIHAMPFDWAQTLFSMVIQRNKPCIMSAMMVILTSVRIIVIENEKMIHSDVMAGTKRI